MLTLSRKQYDEMIAHLRAHWPEEACGLLGGVNGRVRLVCPVENALHSPVAYSMEPRQQVEAMMAIERQGWDLLAIFHSHPAGLPAPSASDVAQAYYPDSWYVIVAPDRAGEYQSRAFEIVEGRVREVEMRVEKG